jgi:sugar diacid utilization regulator
MAMGDAERALGYAFTTGVHLALTVERATRSEVERCGAKLLAAAGAHSHLIHFHGAARWLVWIRFERHPAPESLTGMVCALSDLGLMAAMGEPGEGLRGFRQSRRDALEASSLRGRFHGFPPVLWYRDVRLEALLMNDEESARRFVIDELGELAGPGARLARDRETLRVWLMTGSISQAGAQLWIHDNTVRLRVAQAEKKLPGDPRGRRTEVLAALRLRAMFDDPPTV